MSGRADTKLDSLIANCLAVVYHSNQMVHYSNIAVMCIHQFVPLHYSRVLHTQPLARFTPLDHQTRSIPAESRSAIATIGLARSDQPFPLATLVGYLAYAL